MIISFCGHSSYIPNDDDRELLLTLFEQVIQGKYVEFFLGGYGNFDHFALKCCQQYKQNHSNCKIIFVAPYLDERLNERKKILEQLYDEIIYPQLESVPPRFAIVKRNQWMISQSNYVFAYVKTHYGGAYNSLLLADRQKIPYTNIYQGKYQLY